ncbi:hypothetical protein B4U79_11207 [Dinothrombium tinctorium]|uniref:Uncharacterized protein n=1 Tax=Dinothrombium tinctorium TaxID=1965070 RepID=A0A3S3NY78_9ACAR|nr:hypothetical protein B4U79_14177 [Dinothrombium tinctorium]RWS11407.1 hypothetical protein B4U79_02529 [Dinothrombium tinctorium]RWS11506.1 hypothetical protein B4U79_10657 [Dinothrombium tinctorium]RWS13019.1 hypothetical protein B4U79_11207 [Dinothrombium tinctorium]
MNEKQELTFTDSVKLDNKNGNNTETTDKNGNGGGGKRSLLSHSVSIIVEPVFDEESDCEPSALSSTENLSTSGQQSPVLLLDDFDVFEMESQRKTRQEEDIVQSIISTVCCCI